MPGAGRCGIMPGFGRGPPGPAAGRGPPGRGPPAPGAGRGPPAPGAGRGPPAPGAAGCAPPPAAGPGRGLLKGLLPGRGAGRAPPGAPGRGAPGRGAPGAAPPGAAGRGAPGRGAVGCSAGAAGADAAAAAGRGSGRGPGAGAAGRAGAAGAAATGAGAAGARGAGAAGATGAGAGAAAAGAAGAAGRAGREGAAAPFAPLPEPPKASRSRRATGASTVEDADFTNSPCSLSLASTVLLSTPNSLASSCTRALPGTGLLMCEAGGVARSTSSLVVHGHRGNFTADSSDGVLSTCGPARAGPTLELLCCSRSACCGHSPARIPTPGASGEVPSDVVPERTGLQWSTATSGEAQRPGEGPASLRCVQALRRGVQGCSPAGEPSSRIGDESPFPDDDTQQLGDRSAHPAPHTGADRDRRYGHQRV